MRAIITTLTVPHTLSAKHATQSAKEKTEELFRSLRQIIIHAIVFGTEPQPAIHIIHPDHYNNETHKDQFIHIVRNFTKETKAKHAAVVSEAWEVTVNNESKSQQELMEHAKRLMGKVKDQPNRKELVFIAFESTETNPPTTQLKAPIIRNQGRPKLGPWISELTPMHLTISRLANILDPSCYGTHHQA